MGWMCAFFHILHVVFGGMYACSGARCGSCVHGGEQKHYLASHTFSSTPPTWSIPILGLAYLASTLNTWITLILEMKYPSCMASHKPQEAADLVPKPSQEKDLFVLGAIKLFHTNNEMEPFYFMSNLCGCYATTRNLLMEGGGERDERIFTADCLDICSKAIRNENAFLCVEIVFLHEFNFPCSLSKKHVPGSGGTK